LEGKGRGSLCEKETSNKKLPPTKTSSSCRGGGEGGLLQGRRTVLGKKGGPDPVSLVKGEKQLVRGSLPPLQRDCSLTEKKGKKVGESAKLVRKARGDVAGI